MAKQAKSAPAATPTTPTFVVGPKGVRYQGHTGTKFTQALSPTQLDLVTQLGVPATLRGTALVWACIQATLTANGGTIGLTQLVSVCNTLGDKGFTTYCRKNYWLVPASAQ